MTDTPNTDVLSEARAREVLATEFERSDRLSHAAFVRSGVSNPDLDDVVRAMQAFAKEATTPAINDAVPAGKPLAWLHTVHMEHEQTSQRLTFSDGNPWGVPGQDYSAEYPVTSQPLYATATKVASDTGAGLRERAVMVCPQCEGEGGYPDGVDDAACHVECTRCGSNGWIVDLAMIGTAFRIEGDAEARLLREAASFASRIEAAGGLVYEGSNFERWKETARDLAPRLRAALSTDATLSVRSNGEVLEQAARVAEDGARYTEFAGIAADETEKAGTICRVLQAVARDIRALNTNREDAQS